MQRRVLYLAKRHLDYSPEEWRALPWWQTRMYSEGLIWEFTGEEPTVPTDDLDGLAAIGLTVRREAVTE